MERARKITGAALLAASLFSFSAHAQSVGGACPTAGWLSLGAGTSNPGYLLYCNGSTWGLAEAITTGGLIGIGSTGPVSSLDLSQKTDALALPVGTIAQRPSSPANGMLRYDSSGPPALEAYVNGNWETLVTGTGSTSTITLGTLASATNPQVSGDATTGFYTAGAGKVDVAAGGTQIAEWNSAGTNIVTGSLKLAGNNGLWQDAANFNVAVGPTAFPATVSQAGGAPNGQGNIAIGYQALNANTMGASNTAVGYQALSSNTTGQNNTALGMWSLLSNTTGIDNVAVGYGVLYANITGTNNTAIGYDALDGNTTGARNTAVGNAALLSNTTGGFNTAIGNGSLLANSTGANNTALGSLALNKNTTGTNNTVVGNAVASTTLATGSNNILIGTSSAVDTAAAGTNYNLNIGNLLQGDMTNSTSTYNKALYLQSTASGVNYLQVSGAATGNAPVLSAQGTDTNISMELLPKGTGGVGIGTTSPSSALSVVGTVNVDATALNSGTAANFLMFGNSGGSTATGEGIGSQRTGSGNLYGLDFYTGFTGRMSITNGGSVGIGSASPVASLDLSQKTDAIALPSGSTSQRPSSPVNGMIRYDSTSTPTIEAYVNGSWTSMTGGTTPGSLMLISTLTASSSASLQFTNLPTTYNTLFLNCTGLLTSGGGSSVIYFRVGEGAGPTWKAGASYVASVMYVGDSDSSPGGGEITNATDLTASAGNGSSSTIPTSIKMYIDNITSTTIIKNTTFQMSTYNQNASGYYTESGSGYWGGDTNAITGLELVPSSGTIKSGVCSLYGIAN